MGGGRLRNALVDLGWALREHLLWRPADALRTAFEWVKSPFEGAAWGVRRTAWAIEDRTDFWAPAARGMAVGLVVLLGAGAGVTGLLLAAPDHSGDDGTAVATIAAAPVVTAAPVPQPEPPKPTKAEPTLRGATPVFAPTEHEEEPGRKAGTKKASSPASAGASADTSPKPLPTVLSSSARKGASASSSSADKQGAVAGAKAVKVARQFAKAFVLYETGRGDQDVRKTFAETATPELRRSLLRRPPRLPANVKVPKAKVLNVVPGPSHGGVYTVSVSLLRVGLTSELRLDMEPGKGKRWQVTDVLG